MAAPTTPLLTVVNDLTGTTFTATIDGDVGVTNYVYYTSPAGGAWTLGGSRAGDGDVVVTVVGGGRVLVCAISQSTEYSLPSQAKSVLVTANVATFGDIFRAIKEEFDANVAATDPYTLTGGRMWRVCAPAGNQTYPYIVFTMSDGELNRTFSDGDLEAPRITFEVYDEVLKSSDHGRAMDITDGLIRIFDKHVLPMGDGTTALIMVRTGTPEEDADAEMITVRTNYTFERQT